MTKKMNNIKAIFSDMLNANFKKIQYLYITGVCPNVGFITICVDDSNFIVNDGTAEEQIIKRNQYGLRRLNVLLTDFEVKTFDICLWDVYFNDDGEEVYATDGAIYQFTNKNSQFKRVR